jgi:hypothetical protein
VGAEGGVGEGGVGQRLQQELGVGVGREHAGRLEREAVAHGDLVERLGAPHRRAGEQAAQAHAVEVVGQVTGLGPTDLVQRAYHVRPRPVALVACAGVTDEVHLHGAKRRQVEAGTSPPSGSGQPGDTPVSRRGHGREIGSCEREPIDSTALLERGTAAADAA